MSALSGAARSRVIARLREIEDTGGDGIVKLGGGRELRVSSLDRVLFPAPSVTKGEVMRYYTEVAPYLLPLVRDRPLSLKRYPSGVTGEFFFQQKAPGGTPDSVRVETVLSESGEEQERIIGGTLATLLYSVQIGAFEINPWNARVRTLEYPDFSIIDLDPGPRAPFERVVEVALLVRVALEALSLHAAVKTSGSTGIHVGIPLPRNSPERMAEGVARVIASAVAESHPDIATVERSIKQRRAGQVYVDAGQNSRGKTVAAAYSVRAREGATVSTPLRWEELTPELDFRDFTVRTIPARIAAVGDLWGSAMKRANRRQILERIVTTL